MKKDIERAIKDLIPEARISYKPDTLAMQFVRTLDIKSINDTKAREEWGWESLFTDLRITVADFIQELRTNQSRK